ncbi:hypothetical protein MUK60_07720 [Streptomyces sp. LRE541]|uniref:hypothetical protein n=1 Tax=Streptomyces sp. LRE541 TaxID=2931983 RepID=UPI00200CF095|nr:hypothetical protein [Streptomyces sp. LRE541]UPZ27722.1 hypothetical protein MUK60_07720 [Streptomyces sp. LRE541]
MTTTTTTAVDLADLPPTPVYPTGETLRPLLTGNSVRDLRTAFRLHDEGKARKKAHDLTVQAARLQKDGAGVLDVFRALARAEGAAPDDTRPWHAARVDAYSTAHGLRGWYRRTGLHGDHYIVTDRLRLPEAGDEGRYYKHAAAYMHRPLNHWVVDGDSGRVVYRSHSSLIAQQWIDEAEAAP